MLNRNPDRMFCLLYSQKRFLRYSHFNVNVGAFLMLCVFFFRENDAPLGVLVVILIIYFIF